MCYDVTSGLKALIKYAKHRRDDPAYIAALEKKLETWIKELPSHHYVSGFAHPKLMVFTNEKPDEPQAFYWGLIPAWVKDIQTAKTISNQTLNAKCETIFEKPSFRNAAKNKRCLIYLDGFFEHHHQGSKTFPFYIQSVIDEPLAIAGLWEEWVNKETGEIVNTTAIVTTRANGFMNKIHNNPKLEMPRMPVILDKEKQDEWLKPCISDDDKLKLLNLCVPYADANLKYHSVSKLKGKNAVGDNENALKEYSYEDLFPF
ncbi:MAG: SOS response-associated peptidase [Sphingobacteriaceae bacterium]|nr:SOS response-associated peptidase [Sphingobacteriaceae bacterium]